MKDANYAPVYCAMYPELARIARGHGYALAIHGSLGRDMDLICVPWVDTPSAPWVVMHEITSTSAVHLLFTGKAEPKKHGRVAYTISIGHGECAIDLSFLPRAGKDGEQLKRVDQTMFGPVRGNCLPACIATIFEVPIDSVPNFCEQPEGWWSRLRRWVQDTRGFTPVMWPAGGKTKEKVEYHPFPMIAVGPAQRGLKHSVVWQGGEVTHDPHPDRTGISRVDYFIVFEPYKAGADDDDAPVVPPTIIEPARWPEVP